MASSRQSCHISSKLETAKDLQTTSFGPSVGAAVGGVRVPEAAASAGGITKGERKNPEAVSPCPYPTRGIPDAIIPLYSDRGMPPSLVVARPELLGN